MRIRKKTVSVWRENCLEDTWTSVDASYPSIYPDCIVFFFFFKDSSDDQVAKQVGQNSITEGAVAGRMRNYQLCHRLNDHPFCVITSIWLSLSVGIVE